MAAENDVHVVGISSLAGGHKTLLVQLVEELKKIGRANIMVVVGGVIPPQDYEFLKKNGAAAVFGPGTCIPDAAKEMLAQLNRAHERMTRLLESNDRRRMFPACLLATPTAMPRRAAVTRLIREPVPAPHEKKAQEVLQELLSSIPATPNASASPARPASAKALIEAFGCYLVKRGPFSGRPDH